MAAASPGPGGPNVGPATRPHAHPRSPHGGEGFLLRHGKWIRAGHIPKDLGHRVSIPELGRQPGVAEDSLQSELTDSSPRPETRRPKNQTRRGPGRIAPWRNPYTMASGAKG